MEFYLSFQMGRIKGIGAVTVDNFLSWEGKVWAVYGHMDLLSCIFLCFWVCIIHMLLSFFKQDKSPWDIMIHVGINCYSCKRYKAFFRDLSSLSVQNACNSTFWNSVCYRLHGNTGLGNPEPIWILDHKGQCADESHKRQWCNHAISLQRWS